MRSGTFSIIPARISNRVLNTRNLDDFTMHDGTPSACRNSIAKLADHVTRYFVRAELASVLNLVSLSRQEPLRT